MTPLPFTPALGVVWHCRCKRPIQSSPRYQQAPADLDVRDVAVSDGLVGEGAADVERRGSFLHAEGQPLLASRNGPRSQVPPKNRRELRRPVNPVPHNAPPGVRPAPDGRGAARRYGVRWRFGVGGKQVLDDLPDIVGFGRVDFLCSEWREIHAVGGDEPGQAPLVRPLHGLVQRPMQLADGRAGLTGGHEVRVEILDVVGSYRRHRQSLN